MQLESPALATRSRRFERNRTAAILGLGHHVPERVVPNAEIAARLGIDDAWIVKRTGVRSRRFVADGERVTDLAVAAGANALADAGVRPADVDLVLVATMTQDELCPNAAPLVAAELGCAHAGAVDVGAACTAWLSALSFAAGQVEAGRARNVLVIGAEAMSRFTDLDDRATAPLFGDGAGAALVGPGAGSVGSVVLRADGGLAPAIVAERHDPFIRMNGHDTFKAAVGALAESTLEACEQAALSVEDVDLFVYHQANGRIIRAVAQRLGLPREKVADYVAEMANTSAASIPLTLSLLRRDGRLHGGQKVLLGAVGAGFTWGATIVDWPQAEVDA